ncbi:MAG: FAD-dependent oxidoreductase [Promethearchaeota archaeon]
MEKPDTSKEFDVIVVGGGPAGLVFAYQASMNGMNVLVLERGAEFGEKNASGCALSPKCWRDLDFMKRFMDEVPFRYGKRAMMHFIDESREETSSISYSASKRFASYPEAADFLTVNVYRSDLDSWLAKLAGGAGATLRTSSLVTRVEFNKDGTNRVTVNDSEEYHAPLVIGADGAISLVCREARIREKWNNKDLSLMVTLDFEADKEKINDFFGDESVHYYYGTNFPIGYVFFNDDGFHVGLGHYISWFIEQRISPIAALDEFLSTPAVQKVVKMLGARPREFQAHVLPFVSKPSRLHGDGYMVIGDAAGLICPLEAEGVYYAMLAGKIAAGVALDAKKNNDYSGSFLSRFDRAIEKSPIGNEFEFGEIWKEFIDVAPFNLNPAPWITRLIPDALYSAMNVAEAHSDTVKEHAHGRIITLMRLGYPKMRRLIKPLATKLLDEFLEYYMNRFNISALLKPILQSTKKMRGRIIGQVLDDWLIDKKIMEEVEQKVPLLSQRIEKFSKLNLRPLVRVDPPNKPLITHLKDKCTNCANCALICPVKLWRRVDGVLELEENHQDTCLECGACYQACPANAIKFSFPGSGKGVKYIKG